MKPYEHSLLLFITMALPTMLIHLCLEPKELRELIGLAFGAGYCLCGIAHVIVAKREGS